MTPRHAIARLLLLTIILTALPATPGNTVAGQDRNETADESSGEGLRFHLSEGSERIEKTRSNSVALATPLSETETKALLARLPSIRAEAGEVQDFKLRDRSLPPPRAGETIQAAFATPSSGVQPNTSKTTAPLEVLRYAPEGDVALAPGLSITFSQPMVAVASQEEAAAVVPVTLTPQPKGSWHWLGTQTLIFKPEMEGGRLPMATNYTVTIPAGTRSTLGNALPESRTFAFATPPLTLKRSYPIGKSEPRDGLIFLEFDQRIDAGRVLEKIKLQLESSGLRLRPATSEEIAANESIKEFVKRSQEGRWLALRAVDANGSTKDALPADTDITIIIEPDTPSAEGPRLTTGQQAFTFKTFGALRVTDTECADDKHCSPFDPFRITFSNQLDSENFRPSQVSITPEVPGVKVSLNDNSLNIEGLKRSNTDYTVTLDRSIKDRFGQTLAGDNRPIFKVTTAYPRLFATGGDLIVLDPAVRPTFNVYSVNYRRLKVTLYREIPEDWEKFHLYQILLRNQRQTPPEPPGTVVFDKVVDLTSKPDELSETAIDLSPALTNGHGQVLVQVEPVEERGAPVSVDANLPDGRIEAWVQATEIGVDAFVDKGGLVAWANSLQDGRPLEGVEIRAMPEAILGRTEGNGLAHLTFNGAPNTSEQYHTPWLVARRGDDVAILPKSAGRYYGNYANSWRNTDSTESLSWYVFDDRKLYRPGEEVNVKGWIRKVNLTPTGDTELFAAAGETVNYILKDAEDNEVTKGAVNLNALAGFNLKLQLPATMSLGGASLEFKLQKDTDEYTHQFQVQEFRRPEFEIKAEVSEAPHFVGSSATATVTANYYTGGGLANTEINWTVTSTPTNYTPPNRDDYTFGKYYPWWQGDSEDGESNEQTFTGKTNAEGLHTLQMDFEGVNPPRPSSVIAEARVQDVNRQTLAASTSMLVHPADVYVGLKSARSFVQKGEAFDITAIATDLDGKARAGRDIHLRFVRLDYVFEKGEWKQKEVDPQGQTIRSGTDGARVSLATTEGGAYRLTARVSDDRERMNESELLLWVAGGALPPNRKIDREKVELIPDRKTYAGGNVAEILVQSPFTPAEGVMTLRRSGLLRTERFTMNESSYTLRIPIDEVMTPNVHVQVDLVGASTRVNDEGKSRADLPKRTAYASGELNFEIPPVTRRLSVTVTPRDAVLEPGAETVVYVEVKDAQGRSVQGTDTAVVVVDESVLALSRYRLGDPLSVFYPARDADVSDYHLREQVKLANPDEVERLARAGSPGGGGGGGIEARQITELPINGRSSKFLLDGVSNAALLETQSASMASVGTNRGVEDSSPVELRKNFNALAVFAASVPTDAQGRAQVKIRLPDNLTRYRVAAVSVAGGKLAGSGESVITARKQLMARPSAPRFLNFGDKAELPIVLQNQTNEAMNVAVAVRATNAELIEGAGRRVVVPANDRVEVRFPVATLKAGTARFQVVTSSGKLSDAAEVTLPIYTPATTEAFATYGTIDEGSIAQPVNAPADAIKSFGGLDVTTSSTQLQELTDAVIYLVGYPYECSEQISSRIIAIAALKDVLTAFKAKGLPSPEAMRASVSADIKHLEGLQNEDGGFDFWRHTERSVPFISVHVSHALARARSKGFAVPEGMMEKSQGYLRAIEAKIPTEYSFESRRAIQAYALYVRSLMKDQDPAKARNLIIDAGGVEKLSIETLGWLLPVLSGDVDSSAQVEALRRYLSNRVTETAGAAHFADSYSDGAYTLLYSDRRSDGVLLDALIGDQPKSDLIPKLVRGLLGGRKRGHWLNTQENVFILLALDRYFNTYEKTTPDFVARVWLGKGYAGEQTFKGRSIDRHQLNLPMSALVERTASGPADLTIGKVGAGRLYYRIGSQYAPSNLKLAEADYGFRVERKYEAIDNPSDVRRDEDGVWHIKAGSRVRVRLMMSNQARRYHVALVDPLPAGLEALNPELAVTEKLPDESTEAGTFHGGSGISDLYWYWRGTWYEHQNLHDERVEAFTSLLWEGEHEYIYFARATTLGLFIVPPAKAEEMYEPETFGRGRSDRVRVE